MSQSGRVVSQRIVWTAVACVLAASPWRTALQAQETTGRIDGLATIAARLTSPRQRVRVYNEPGAVAQRPPPDEHPFSSVVIALESTPALRVPARAGPAHAMRQRDERFLPHVLAIGTGTAVDFPNDDPIYHNVFSLSRVRTFDLGRYARGHSKQVAFQAAGVVQVFCHIHADMRGFILVFDHPFFTVPDANGRFSLAGVPPGDYQLVAWHERVRPVAVPVRVTAGGVAVVQVDLPVMAGPASP